MSEDLNKRLENVEHSLYGNGRPGLTDRVTVIETKLATGTKLLWLILALSLPPLIDLIKSIQ